MAPQAFEDEQINYFINNINVHKQNIFDIGAHGGLYKF